MLNLTYLAVLEPGEDGSYSVSFPDLPGRRGRQLQRFLS